jgi:hypothetical protein
MTSNIKPRFQTKKLEGTYIKRCAVYVHTLDENNEKTDQRRLEYVDKECPKGWMVYFPNGASIHIATMEELKRMGYDKIAPLQDLESGEIVSDPGGFDLERDVERKTKPTRSSNMSAVKKG